MRGSGRDQFGLKGIVGRGGRCVVGVVSIGQGDQGGRKPV